LGVSSHQLDTAVRGFSYRFNGPLDLRMDTSSRAETAAELLTRLSEAELTNLIRSYGEDSQARRIAKAIVREREREPITSTDDLARIISKSVPATRTKSLARVFQALRIAVNHEIEELSAGLEAVWPILRPGGRIVVISYHSLEDRPVKNFMKSKTEAPLDALGFPVPTGDKSRGRLVLRKPQIPSEREIRQNPRARSAKLRCIEKLNWALTVMAYTSPSLPESLYRPRKLPRVIRRQLPTVRLCAAILLAGLLAVAVVWRNLGHERLVLDIGLQRSQMETLRKEIQQLGGQIETEASYPRLSKWARDQRGWRPLSDHQKTLTLNASDLTPTARDQAKTLVEAAHE
jgi:hypothetical protein